MAKVAFLGLGVMGYPMAGHLQKKGGHDVTVYNRTAAKAQQWVKEQGAGKHAATPRDAAKDCDFVMMCVGNDDDVRSVVYGDAGALAGMKKGAILVDHTTASAALAKELFEKARERGIGFIDAPVSGGQAGAQNGQLGIMCGGMQADFDRAKPVIDVYAKLAALIGAPGAGQLTKMVNQICIAGLEVRVELVDQRGHRQAGAARLGLAQADAQVLAHPFDGEAEALGLELAHLLPAVLHLP